jgi:acyl-homoserine-lactone acylase
VLRSWDYRWGAGSVPQALAMLYGDQLRKALNPPADEPGNKVMMRLARDTSPVQKLQALTDAVTRMRRDFGAWQVPWGEINRLQRLSDSVEPQFSDAAPSIPVPFASGAYGSLAAIEMRVRSDLIEDFTGAASSNTKRLYGTYGNTFVAVVEFGKRIRARAVTAGGVSGSPASPHFNDQAEHYASGALRDVYFYPDQLERHTERRYKPGE